MNKDDIDEVNSILKDPNWQGEQTEIYSHCKKCEICEKLAQSAMLISESMKIHMIEKNK